MLIDYALENQWVNNIGNPWQLSHQYNPIQNVTNPALFSLLLHPDYPMKLLPVKLAFLLAFLSLQFVSYSQPELDSYDDGVYRDYIRSVRMHVTGLYLSLPIASLGAENALFLSFDELDGKGTRYYYTVIHCDRNWRPTQELSQFDYLGGYREGEIRDYEFSSGTYQDYLQYKLTIPNDEVKWSISGNYLLVVYEAGEENNPILTRRFLVTEEKIGFKTEVSRPAVVSKQNTYQEIDFGIETAALNSSNPRAEISCVIMQNGRWDNAVRDVEPRLVTGTYLSYDYQDKIVFEAGKEFRNLDISSMIYKSEFVLDIEEYPEGYSTILFHDEPRAQMAYLWRRDLNGMYVPYNRDYSRRGIPFDSLASTINLVTRYNYREQNLSTEYSEVLFTLNLPEDFGREIYVVGGMTDWKMLPENKLTFDDRVGAYIARLYLKQGYYNYAYAVPDEHHHPDFSVIEGNWYATENLYSILVYYRPRGSQYDKLVGVHTFNSNH
jgi:hypothetical protein